MRFWGWVLAVVLAGGIAAAAEPELGRVRGSSVNVRQQPELAASVVGKLRQGDEVRIVAKRGDWLEICAPSVYVSAAYVRDGKTTAAVRLRSAPSTAAPILKVAAVGMAVKTAEEKDGWLRLEPTPEVTAYVAASLVTGAAGEPVSKPDPDRKPADAEPSEKPATPPKPVVEDRPFADLPVVDGSAKRLTQKGLLTAVKSEAAGVRFALFRLAGDKYVLSCFVHTGGSSRFDRFADRTVTLEGVIYRVENWKTPVMKVSRIIAE